MSLNYKNHQLFSEIFLQDLIEKEIINKNYEDYFKAFIDWGNFADFSTEEKIIESYLIPISNTLGFILKKDKENPNVLRLFNISDENEFLSYCYLVNPKEDINCYFKGKFWPAKLIKILQENKKSWGILTNGHVWRLYYIKEPNVYENYFEVDLKEILDKKNIDSFNLFYYFFNASNYRLNKDNVCSYDLFKASSIKAIEYLGEKLKHSIEREKSDEPGALQALCQGFISYINKDFYKEAERTNIYGSSILLLFRILFLFYASSRELLSNADSFNFKKLVKESFYLVISNSYEKKEYNLWKILQELFTNIDFTYDGGLFDPAENTFTQFIEVNKISDFYISRVLYELGYWAKSKVKTIEIDYKDLSVRHFGSLYEGLLEHNLFIAEENLIIRKSDNKINFIPESKIGNINKTDTIIEKGKIYFSDDPTERKDTGSYYTPEDVVEYIVQNTLGSLLKEKKEEFSNEIREYLDEIRLAISESELIRIKNFVDKRILDFINNEILEITVLDPTMGSGHFLVNALNLLTNFVIETLNETSWYNLNIDSNPIFWKRRIISSCIFGVDLNPLAVELAKLCLWIISAEKDKPLSFINHHLKCGNSLIGVFTKDIEEFSINKKSNINLFLSSYLENLKEISEKYISTFYKVDDSKLDTDTKKEIFLKVNKNIEPLKNLYDLFIENITKNKSLTEFEETFIEIVNCEKMKDSSTNYFHWEIEFPDIFFKENQGFSCIIGNPPYVDVNKDLIIQFKIRAKKTYSCRNLYAYVTELSLELLKNDGFLGLIVPGSIVFSKRMLPLQEIIRSHTVYFYNLDSTSNPSSIFNNVKTQITIFNLKKNFNNTIETTKYLRFFAKDRSRIFEDINFIRIEDADILNYSIPKISFKVEKNIIKKIFSKKKRIKDFISSDQNNEVFYRSAGLSYYTLAFKQPPYIELNGQKTISSTTNKVFMIKNSYIDTFYCLIFSSLFYWYWSVYSDLFHLTLDNIIQFPIDFEELLMLEKNFKLISEKIENSLFLNSKEVIYKKNKGNTSYREIYPRLSKNIFDEVDILLADYYCFSKDELNFIINYNIEFRIN